MLHVLGWRLTTGVIEPVLSAEVAAAVADGRAVVAMESTIFSHLGLPSPANAEALERCLAAVRDGGAVPAVTAVVDGVARVGIDEAEHERILGPARKAAERDVPVAIAQRWPLGATTVSASVALAHAAGVKVFATGGIGGVHRGSEITGDISRRPRRHCRHPVVTVCAGAKAFLDLARTLEYLETGGRAGAGLAPRRLPCVLHPVVGAAGAPPGRLGDRGGGGPGQPDPVDHRRAGRPRRSPRPMPSTSPSSTPCSRGHWPTPTPPASPAPRSTPFVLGRIAEATAGRSIPANLALAEHNAAVAAEIAVAIAGLASIAGRAPIGSIGQVRSRAGATELTKGGDGLSG